MSQELTMESEPGTRRSMTGGRAIAEMLAAHDVGPMFGMGGFQLLPFYEGVRQLGLTHHLINDERSGVFAADAYARITGRPGVCDATMGPGATNLVTGLVESLNAGIPMVVLTGNAHRDHAGKNMTQETRQIDILRPACKELIRVEHAKRIPELVRRAFAVATSGRPGPVVLDVPEDVAHAEWSYDEADFWADVAATRAPSCRIRPDRGSVRAAVDLLSSAKRPVLLVGGGVHLSRAYNALRELAESQGIPVAHTMSGKGAVSCASDASVGVFGRYSRYANDLIEASDCLLVVGCKLGEVATKRYSIPRPDARIVHIDIVAEEIGRWARVDVALWGDARATLEEINDQLRRDGTRGRDNREAYLAEIAQTRLAWHAAVRERYLSDETPIAMARLMHELNEVLPAEATLVLDGGFASHWGALLYDTKIAGRGFVADRGFASIGYGAPGALGAALANPGGPVVGLTGDSAMNMTLGDLEVARRAGAAFVLIVVNNAASGYIKGLQHAVYGQDAYQSSDLHELDYARLAEVMGCRGIRVEDPSEIRGALESALAEEGRPTVIDVVVTRDPAKMLPGIDSRTVTVAAGDRPV